MNHRKVIIGMIFLPRARRCRGRLPCQFAQRDPERDYYRTLVIVAPGRERRTGKKKPLREIRTGASQSDDGTFADRYQDIDRVNDRYKKKVTKADGAVVKDVDGRLTDQSLHGAPKKA